MDTPAGRSTIWWVVVVLLGAALVWALRDLLVLAGLAVLLAYALDPFVSRLEQVPLPRGGHISRGFSAAIVMLLVAAAAGGFLYLTLPRLAAEFGHFLQKIPGSLQQMLNEIRAYAAERGLGGYMATGPDGQPLDTAGLVQYLAEQAAGWLGGLFGRVDSLLALFVLPLLSFYLLKEPHWAARSVLRYVPDGGNDRAHRAIAAADTALRSYVRGQAVVCLTVGGFTAIVLTMLGVPLALLLGVIAALGEVLPFIGASITIVSIGLVGFGSSPMLGFLGVLAYVTINTLSSFLVTPRVMNRYLELHPFVVILAVLAGGRLLGPPGVLVALPLTAIVQALIQEFVPRDESGDEPKRRRSERPSRRDGHAHDQR